MWICMEDTEMDTNRKLIYHSRNRNLWSSDDIVTNWKLKTMNNVTKMKWFLKFTHLLGDVIIIAYFTQQKTNHIFGFDVV